MAVFWITVLMAVAAFGAIATVLKSIRFQEKELALYEPFEVAPGGSERPK